MQVPVVLYGAYRWSSEGGRQHCYSCETRLATASGTVHGATGELLLVFHSKLRKLPEFCCFCHKTMYSAFLPVTDTCMQDRKNPPTAFKRIWTCFEAPPSSVRRETTCKFRGNWRRLIMGESVAQSDSMHVSTLLKWQHKKCSTLLKR